MPEGSRAAQQESLLGGSWESGALPQRWQEKSELLQGSRSSVGGAWEICESCKKSGKIA